MTAKKAKPRLVSKKPEEKFEVVRAVPYDLVPVCRCLEEWLESASRVYPDPEPAALMTWVLNTIVEGHVLLAMRPTNRRSIMGVAGMIVATVPWNPKTFVYRDQFFYVPKAHQRKGIAKELMKGLQTRAALDETPLIMGIISGTNTGPIDKWYGLEGNDYVGGTFVYGLPSQTPR